MEAAQRRYGAVSTQVGERLDEEFRLIRMHRLAGFLLLYREIVLLAQAITEKKGLAPPETPWRSGRQAGGAARRSPCWRATSSASATSTRSGGT